jgi:hypothetical protein
MFLKRNPLAFLLFLLLFLLGAGVFSYSFFLPRYIENKILPDLGRQLSSSLTGRVYNIGYSAADFGDLVLGNPENPAVSIGSVHADYSLPSLLAKNLGQVRINGLTLHLEVSDGKLIIPGVDLEQIATQETGQKSTQETLKKDLPFELSHFQVSNGRIELTYVGEHFLIPFDLQLNRQPAGDGLFVYNLTLQLMPLGEEITLAGTIDLTGNNSNLTLSADSLDMRKFVVLAGGNGSGINFSKTSIRGQAEFGLLPFQLLSAHLFVDPQLLHFGKMPVHFGHITPDAGPAILLELKNEGEQMLINAQAFISQPLSASLELNASATLEQEGMQRSGNVAIRITEPMSAENTSQTVLMLKSFPDLHGDFILGRDKSGAWKAELRSSAQKQNNIQSQHLHVHYDTISLQSGIPSFSVLGQGTAEADEIQVSLAVPNIKVRYDGAEITLPEAGLQATFIQKADPDRGRTSSTVFRLALGSMKFNKNGLSGKADISLQGNMMPQLINGIKTLQTEGKLTLRNAEITERDSTVELAALEGNIPWIWPQTGREMAGEIKVPRIRWKDLDLGSFSADIKIKDMMYFLDGTYNSRLLKGIVTNVSGKAGKTDSGFQGEFAAQMDVTPFPSMHLGKFDSSLNNSYFSGELGLDTSLKFDAGGLQGMMQLRLQNGTLEFPEKKYMLKGIDLNMFIPSLPDLRTAPAQTLNFTEASIGNLAFSKGKLVWQLESKESLFLEEGAVQWAGGHVFTNSVRISPDMKEYVVPIFCDRLKLTDLLQQFGVVNAQGEGTVSGRIPMHVSKGVVRFEDGFLYTSPGQGGNVKIASFDLLTAGIPKNSPQFAQIDFAAEALKNFQYNWVRLLLNSEGENLIMQMQIDGNPLKSLPFAYDSQTGLLQRIEDAGKGINQPIRLDVNFRLPLNRFLGYSGKFQDLIKKMQ